MNILFVTPYYVCTSSGGIESHVKTISHALSKQHHCVVIAPSSGENDFFTDNSVNIYRTPFVNPHMGIAPQIQESHRFFQQIIEEEKIDRVIAHNLHTWIHQNVTTGLIAATQTANVPVFLRLHNFCHADEVKYLQAFGWHGLICVSNCLADQVASLGIDRKCIHVVYPPVDQDLFRPTTSDYLYKILPIPDGSSIFLHASRLVGGPGMLQHKGILTLLKVFIEIEGSHLVFCAAHPPPELSEEYGRQVQIIREVAASLSLADRIHIISASYEDMPLVYNSAQILILLSQLETFGRVFAEASACGLPVIGTNVGGIPEAIDHGVTGFLVDTIDDAHRALISLQNNPTLRHEMGSAGRSYVKRRFSIAKFNKEFMKILIAV